MKATEVTAGLAKSNGSPQPGGWLKVTCGLTACTPRSAPSPMLGNEYRRTLSFYHSGQQNVGNHISNHRGYRNISAPHETVGSVWKDPRNPPKRVTSLCSDSFWIEWDVKPQLNSHSSYKLCLTVTTNSSKNHLPRIPKICVSQPHSSLQDDTNITVYTSSNNHNQFHA